MASGTAIVRFEKHVEQEIGEITKVIGLVRAKGIIPIIDSFNLEANPRDAKTGMVTDAIQESIATDRDLFPFKTKGILLASSRYIRLERNRFEIIPDDRNVEGILDGGHNTLAIGLYILRQSMNFAGLNLPRGKKTWEDFKKLWSENRNTIDEYLKAARNNRDQGIDDLNFFIPVELLLPRDPDDYQSLETFKSNLLDICAARNNNVQLNSAAKANQHGYFDTLRSMLENEDSQLANRIEWKTNDGGEIKVQDLIALAWIPLSLISPIKDNRGQIIEPPAANKIYGSKGSCLTAFERLMGSNEVTSSTSSDYKRELHNQPVASALRITVELPKLVNYIYCEFPNLYNMAGGSYGRIRAVKKLNEMRKDKTAPFATEQLETLSPDGFIVPLVYGLQTLMKRDEKTGCISWVEDPMHFLQNNLGKIVKRYVDVFQPWDWDPTRIGKAPQSYNTAVDAYKMARVGIL